MLIVSPEFNCSQEILTIVAMFSGTFLLLHVLIRLTVSLQSLTYGYDRTTGRKKRILRSNC
jgi:hypothetical protein